MITLTDAEVQKDLERAVVRFSVVPSERAPEVLKILARCAPKLRFILMREINIKPMPRIVFEIDSGLERAADIEKALLHLIETKYSGQIEEGEDDVSDESSKAAAGEDDAEDIDE